MASDIIDDHDLQVLRQHLDLLTPEEEQRLDPDELERRRKLQRYQTGHENWQKFEQYLKRIFERRDQ